MLLTKPHFSFKEFSISKFDTVEKHLRGSSRGFNCWMMLLKSIIIEREQSQRATPKAFIMQPHIKLLIATN